jgi:hypothetical protein
VRSKIAASKKSIKTHSSIALLEEMGRPSSFVYEIRQSLPRPRSKAMSAPSIDTSASQRLKFIMTGGLDTTERSTLLEGESEKTLEEIIEVLKREQVI